MRYFVTLEFPPPYNCDCGEIDFATVDASDPEEAGDKARMCVLHRVRICKVAEIPAERADANPPSSPSLPAKPFWTPSCVRPAGFERPLLLWVVWPECGRPRPPESIKGWWRHGPGCFAVENVENADHLVTHWAEIPDPE